MPGEKKNKTGKKKVGGARRTRKNYKKANKTINPKKKIAFFSLKILTNSKMQNKKTIKINKLDKTFW